MNHRPRKRFGQNFLIDPNISGKIAALIDAGPDDTVVEIGPGQGALTAILLATGCELHCVEIDRDLQRTLARRFSASDRFHLHPGDALKTDFHALTGGKPFRLVGNLPYNISTPLIFHAMNFCPVIRDMIFMLQNEVVMRMTAAPGSKSYGRLSVMTQLHCRVTPHFMVRPGAFRPAPAVDSRIVQLVPHTSPPVELDDREHFAQLVQRAFGQRRKTLRNALKGILDADAIRGCGIDPGARAENLDLKAFAVLSRVAKAGHSSKL